MTNINEDYQLIDAEEEAIKTSSKAKRVVLGAAAVAGAGASAYAADAAYDYTHKDEGLSNHDIDGGIKAGDITEETLDPVTTPTKTINTNEVVITKDDNDTHPADEDDVQFNRSTYLYNEEGEYIGGYDEGTINGKDFSIIDYDGDGIADVMTYDENGNRIIDDNEIVQLDKDTIIPIGNSDHSHYERIETGQAEEQTIEQEPEVRISGSTLFFDGETDEYIGGVDKGTVDGRGMMLIDGDGDLVADVIAIDSNDNHVFEDHEFHELDDDTNILIGKSPNLELATVWEDPEDIDEPSMPGNDYYAGIDPENADQDILSAGVTPATETEEVDMLADIVPEDDPIIPDDTVGLV